MPGRFVGLFLQVRRDDHRGRRPAGHRRADRSVQRVGELIRDVHFDQVVRGHVLEQRLQIHLLLVAAAHRAARGLADDGDDRHVIEFRVVETVEQVDRAGARSRGAHSHLTTELRVAGGLERGHLLVPALYEPRGVVGSPECGDQAVDAVPGVTENLFDTPFPQSLENVVRYLYRHGCSRFRSRYRWRRSTLKGTAGDRGRTDRVDAVCPDGATGRPYRKHRALNSVIVLGWRTQGVISRDGTQSRGGFARFGRASARAGSSLGRLTNQSSVAV